MNNNIYANMKAYAELKRNPFPLDFSVTYSEKLGEITPIKCLHTIPNDFMEVSMAEKSLSFPMNTSAFLSARKEIAVYHVPYNHVCSLFNQMQATRPDPKSSAVVNLNDLVGGEKTIRLADLYFEVLHQHLTYCCYKYFVPLFVSDTDHYMLTHPTFLDEDFHLEWNGRDFTFITGYSDSPDLHIFANALPDGFFFGTDDFDEYWVHFTNGFDILNRPRSYGHCRKLDMLGYGNLYPILKRMEDSFAAVYAREKDQEGRVVFDQQSKDEISCAICAAVCTMSEMSRNGFRYHFTFGPSSVGKYYLPCTVDAVGVERRVSLYPILSYNKIFYEFFRNPIYDLDYKVSDYNIDWAYNSLEHAHDIRITDFSLRFLDIEYHQYKKDLITGSMPSPQFGAVSELNFNPIVSSSINGDGGSNFVTGFDSGRWSTDRPMWSEDGTVVTGNNNLKDNDTQSYLKHDHSFSPDILATRFRVNSSSSASFNVIELKRAEMLQEYRQVLLRNGNRTGDLFKGIYGSRPASEDDNAPRFIDVFGSNIFVDTIVSTADTSSEGKVGGHLGDLGARAVISNGGKFKFKTSDFGCLIFLSYIVPDNEYSSVMLDENLIASDPESHFLPFFQNLGFQPILSPFVNLYKRQGEDKQDHIYGYAPSYSKFKQVLSTAHGNFIALQVPKAYAQLVTSNHDDFVGSFNHWVALNTLIQSTPSSTLAQFYVSPSMWDNVFVQKAEVDFESDHFVCRSRFSIKAVRSLSKLGLPNF